MFERFTDRARRVVVSAQDEARRLGHDYIGTEHLLLGLLDDGECLGARALTATGIGLDSVRARVEEAVAPGQGQGGGHIPFTPAAKQSLELSLREALRLGHHHIGTEHLLLGLIAEREALAGQVLAGLGADLERMRGQVARLVAAHPAGPAGHPPAAWATGIPAATASSTGKLDEVLDRVRAIADRMDGFAEALDGFADRLAAIERIVSGADRASPNGEDEPYP